MAFRLVYRSLPKSTSALGPRATLLNRPAISLSPSCQRLYSNEPMDPEADKKAAEEDKKPKQPEEPPKEKSMQEILAEKDKQIAALQDLYRRALADAENIRQRAKKEIDDTAAYSITKFAKDLLDTSDFLEMALQSVPEQERGEHPTNKPLKDLYTGVHLTRNEMMKTFGKYGIHEYDPMGQVFDPNLHNALFQAPVQGKEPGTVFSVQKTGFKIQDRVLRAAQVGVVKGADS